MKLTIDFKESVLGCKKEVKYSRKAKCPDCDGAGEIRLDNGCTRCGGKGQITVHNVVWSSLAPVHNVVVGLVPRIVSLVMQKEPYTQTCLYTCLCLRVVLDGNTLRLQGMGNYAGSVMGIMDQYTDAFCHITVKPDAGLSIDGRNVVIYI